MNKVCLKDNIWIKGLNSIPILKDIKNSDMLYNGVLHIIYSGKTSEIPEEIAKECVKNWRTDGLYHNYKISSQYEEYMFKTAKESIQSACPQEFCIIYKTK